MLVVASGGTGQGHLRRCRGDTAVTSSDSFNGIDALLSSTQVSREREGVLCDQHISLLCHVTQAITW